MISATMGLIQLCEVPHNWINFRDYPETTDRLAELGFNFSDGNDVEVPG